LGFSHQNVDGTLPHWLGCTVLPYYCQRMAQAALADVKYIVKLNTQTDATEASPKRNKTVADLSYKMVDMRFIRRRADFGFQHLSSSSYAA
jgi:hypothetical protein